MSINKIRRLKQSIWSDFISKSYLESGEFDHHIDLGVTGATSNPAIFKKAIASSDYDDDISHFSAIGKNSTDIYEELACREILTAAEKLRPVYECTENDGYISIEVDPAYANRVDETVYEAAAWHQLIDAPNVMVKIPATDAGIEAFKQVIREGINVNMTLLFSVDQYERVARAYVEALQNRASDGNDLNVASVASFFVSRIDTAVDNALQASASMASPHLAAEIQRLAGKAAVFNAHRAYRVYHDIFHSHEFMELTRKGAQPQRLLWASTSVKNPDFPKLKYVKALLSADTINTLPLETLNDVLSYPGEYMAVRMDSSYEADEYFERLNKVLRTTFSKITDQLLEDGVRAFASSYDDLMLHLYNKTASKRDVQHAC